MKTINIKVKLSSLLLALGVASMALTPILALADDAYLYVSPQSRYVRDEVRYNYNQPQMQCVDNNNDGYCDSTYSSGYYDSYPGYYGSGAGVGVGVGPVGVNVGVGSNYYRDGGYNRGYNRGYDHGGFGVGFGRSGFGGHGGHGRR